MGSAGGAWRKGEIIIQEDPTLDDIKQIIEGLTPKFLLLILIGHGAMQNDRQLFQLNRQTIIKPGQIGVDVQKQLVILESCRRPTNGKIKTVDLNDRIPQYKYGGIVRAPRSLEEARLLYIRLIQRCSKGTVICFPCQKGEVASGYYFSHALLTRSFEWHLLNYNKYFPITELMQYVAPDVLVVSKGKQYPEVQGNIEFPFALSKF